MAVSTEESPAYGASLSAVISNGIVRLLREFTGRGPIKARTTIRDDVVVVMLERMLAKGERSLARKGRAEQVLAIRHEFQEAMREESSAEVAELTGCGVTAMLSADHVDPDLGAEIYVLDRAPDYDARTWEAAAEIIVDGDGPATVETDGR